MESNRSVNSREEIFSICQSLQKMIPPIDLKSAKADETLRYWLPDLSWDIIDKHKKEFIAQQSRR